MKYGTNYFASYTSARNYYALYGFHREDVGAKIKEKEIFIGQPQIKSNQRLSLDEDGRYWVEEK